MLGSPKQSSCIKEGRKERKTDKKISDHLNLCSTQNIEIKISVVKICSIRHILYIHIEIRTVFLMAYVVLLCAT